MSQGMDMTSSMGLILTEGVPDLDIRRVRNRLDAAAMRRRRRSRLG
jgi:hypothetical protein